MGTSGGVLLLQLSPQWAKSPVLPQGRLMALKKLRVLKELGLTQPPPKTWPQAGCQICASSASQPQMPFQLGQVDTGKCCSLFVPWLFYGFIGISRSSQFNTVSKHSCWKMVTQWHLDTTLGFVYSSFFRPKENQTHSRVRESDLFPLVLMS